MNATNGEKPRLNLRDDIARCEMCITLAARAGVRIPEDILRNVNYARADLDGGKISPERESTFYNAMAYIVAKAPYPNAKVADDLKRCSEVVSHAGLNGKQLEESDIDAVAVARQAQKGLYVVSHGGSTVLRRDEPDHRSNRAGRRRNSRHGSAQRRAHRD